MPVAGDAPARFEIEGQGRIARGDGGQRVAGGGGQDGPAETRVHDHARGIDSRGEGGGELFLETEAQPVDEGRDRDVGSVRAAGAFRAVAAGRGGRCDRRPDVVEGVSGGGRHGLASEPVDEGADAGLGQKGVERGDESIGRRFRRVGHGRGDRDPLISGAS